MDIENLPSLLPLDFGNQADPGRPILSTDYCATGAHRISGHQHPRAQILYTTRGVYRASTPLGNWVVPAGQALWIPSHIYHELYSNDSANSLLLFVDESCTQSMPGACVVINVSTFLHELFVKAVSMGNDYLQGGRQSHVVQVLLDEINDMHAAPLHLPLAEDKRVRRVMEYLLEHPDDKGKLDIYADYAGASVRNLSRLFKKETGMNFSDWRKQLLLMEAIDRLGQGQTVTRVAMDLGYSSASAFIAMFRGTLGVSPRHYLKKE
ncbi:MAG: helix-turn-helix transcriptional regulator [Granulosicoccaceae bacterium]|jgi:AraC-like DNA-binding protein